MLHALFDQFPVPVRQQQLFYVLSYGRPRVSWTHYSSCRAINFIYWLVAVYFSKRLQSFLWSSLVHISTTFSHTVKTVRLCACHSRIKSYLTWLERINFNFRGWSRVGLGSHPQLFAIFYFCNVGLYDRKKCSETSLRFHSVVAYTTMPAEVYSQRKHRFQFRNFATL